MSKLYESYLLFNWKLVIQYFLTNRLNLKNDIYNAENVVFFSKLMIRYMYNLFSHFVNQQTNCEYLNILQIIFIHT